MVVVMGGMLLVFDALRPSQVPAPAAASTNSLAGGKPESSSIGADLKAALGWLLHTIINVVFASFGSLGLWQKAALPAAWSLSHAAARCIRPRRSQQRRSECLHALSITFGNTGATRGFSIKLIDLASLLFCLSLGMLWLVLRLLRWHTAGSLVTEAALQDLLCAALVAMVIALLQADALKVCAALLVFAMFYDVFFVFVSPLLFGHSVMMAVAQGGARGGEGADSVGVGRAEHRNAALQPAPGHVGLGGLWDLDGSAASRFTKSSYCAVHPGAAVCPVPMGLPMMLTIPAALGLGGGGGDGYAHQSAMLGLGDLVIPSVLLCFARRYDRAMGTASLRGVSARGSEGGGEIDTGGCCSLSGWCMATLRSYSEGYFGLAVFGYALGLGLAFSLVHFTGRAQPALLYLGPCVCGPVMLVAWRKGLLRDMWDGTGLAPVRSGDGGGGGGGSGSSDVGVALFGAPGSPPQRTYGGAGDYTADAAAESESLFVGRNDATSAKTGEALLARFSSAPVDTRGNINISAHDEDDNDGDWMDPSYDDEAL